MWKKLRGKETPSSIIVGNPTLLESTYDQGQLDRAENIQDSGNYGYNPNSRPPISTNAQREVDQVPARLPTMQLYADTSRIELD